MFLKEILKSTDSIYKYNENQISTLKVVCISIHLFSLLVKSKKANKKKNQELIGRLNEIKIKQAQFREKTSVSNQKEHIINGSIKMDYSENLSNSNNMEVQETTSTMLDTTGFYSLQTLFSLFEIYLKLRSNLYSNLVLKKS